MYILCKGHLNLAYIPVSLCGVPHLGPSVSGEQRGNDSQRETGRQRTNQDTDRERDRDRDRDRDRWEEDRLESGKRGLRERRRQMEAGRTESEDEWRTGSEDYRDERVSLTS
jgi:hypothetical protein